MGGAARNADRTVAALGPMLVARVAFHGLSGQARRQTITRAPPAATPTLHPRAAIGDCLSYMRNWSDKGSLWLGKWPRRGQRDCVWVGWRGGGKTTVVDVGHMHRSYGGPHGHHRR